MTEPIISPSWTPAQGPAASVTYSEDIRPGVPPSSTLTVCLTRPGVNRDARGHLPGQIELIELIDENWHENAALRAISDARKRVEAAQKELARLERTLTRVQVDLDEAIDAPPTPGQAEQIAANQVEAATLRQRITATREGIATLEARQLEAYRRARAELATVARLAVLRLRETTLARLDDCWQRLAAVAGPILDELLELAHVQAFTLLAGDMHTAVGTSLLPPLPTREPTGPTMLPPLGAPQILTRIAPPATTPAPPAAVDSTLAEQKAEPAIPRLPRRLRR
ncbi:MAG: hypothetical protein U0840_21650 [Gemmataceae bacterium]